MSRDAILVLGMHRSGTSATSGALARLGIALGANLVEPAEDNPLGYFEHGPVVAAHESFLEALGRTWADPRPLPEAAFATPMAAACRETLLHALRADFDRVPCWAVKDPRLSRLLPLWTPLWEALGAMPRALVVLRHPAEVAASLARRDGFPAELAHWLWLRHTLEALAGTRGWPRALLAYDALVGAPEATLMDALARIGLSPPAGTGDALSRFVDAGMNHHRGLRPAAGGIAARLAFEAFDRLVAMGGDPDDAAIEALEARCEAEWVVAAPAVEAGLATVARLVADRAALRSDLLGARSALAAQVRWSESAVADLTALREQAEADRHAVSQERDAHRFAIEEQARVEAALRRDLAFAERLVHEREAERDAARAAGAALADRVEAQHVAAEEMARVEAALRRDLAFAERLVHEREAERDALTAERDALTAERDALTAERDALTAERDALTAERDALRHDLDLVLASRSWRWTAPLRRFAGLLKRTLR